MDPKLRPFFHARIFFILFKDGFFALCGISRKTAFEKNRGRGGDSIKKQKTCHPSLPLITKKI
jgi:hypothetical protein